MTILNRRTLLTGATLAAGQLALIGTPTPAVAESALKPRIQAPGFHRIRIGDTVVTALLDGYIDILPEWWINTSPEALEGALSSQFLNPAAPLRISVNAFVVETGGQTIVIDAGADTFFGPTAGAWNTAFLAAGFSADDIDLAIVSHMHPDHIGGLVAGGRAVFPRAGLRVNSLDLDYWTSSAEQARAPDFARPWFDAARDVERLYGDRLVTFTGEAPLAPGITAVPLPGHTPGHTGFVVESGGETLFLWTDVTDFLALQLNAPERTLVFDIDPVEGEASRRRAFGMAVEDRLMVGGAHIPFPGFGHVGRGAGGLRFVPVEWQHEI